MLMKHLAESRETYDRLAALIPSNPYDTKTNYAPASARSMHTQTIETPQPCSASPATHWQVLHFYFDYRIGVSLTNTVIGMMKHFLWQLCSDVSAVAQDLIENPGLLNDTSVEGYTTVLSRVMVKHKLFACAFIDGLDEYGGDLGDLCSHIENLSFRSGIKLCLASRPENPLTAALLEMGCEVILMQDHNLPAIRISINHNLSRFESSNPHLAGWFPDSLRQRIAEKAEGIFLWASLVVDLMTFHVKSNNGPGKDLNEFLSSFPRGLEELYERILGKIKPHNQSDAALILYLLIEHESALPSQECSPINLFQAWNYIGSVMNGQPPGPLDVPPDLYQARLKDILGNLLEFFLNGQAVRLLHKTLKEFLDHSQWIRQCLLTTVGQQFPDSVWIRLARHIVFKLEATSIEEGFKLSDYILKLMEDAAVQSSDQMRDKTERDTSLLSRILFHIREQYIEKLPDLKPWSSVIIFALSSFYSFYNAGDGLPSEIDTMLYYLYPCNATIVLHALDCPVCLPNISQISRVICRLRNAMRSKIFSMALVNAHWTNLGSEEHMTVSFEHIKLLDERVAEDTFDVFLWSCLHKPNLSVQAIGILRAFAEEGYVVGGRHICGLRWARGLEGFIRSLTETDISLAYSVVLTCDKQKQILHDRDCPDKRTLPSPAHHWLSDTADNTRSECERRLQTLLNIGLDLDFCFEREGGVIRAILEEFSSNRNITNTTTKFIALTRSHSPPNVHMSDLQYVEELKQQVTPEVNRWRFYRKGSTEREVHYRFLSCLAKVLQQRYETGTWDQANLRDMEAAYIPF